MLALTRPSHSQRWKRRYIVLRDGATQWYREATADASRGRIPMDVVGGVRMAPERDPLAFCIDAVTRSFVLRASSRDALNAWVFAYHRAAMSVISLLADPHHMPREARLQLSKWWKARAAASSLSSSFESPRPGPVLPRVQSAAEDGGQGIRSGAAWTMGRRPSMEDAHVMVTALCEEYDWLDDGAALAAFGVFDGHGGRTAVDWCARELLLRTCQHPDLEAHPEAALRAAFESADAALCAEQARDGSDRSGSCALVALVRDGELVVANCGDCRAVLVMGEAPALLVEQLTDDHKPNAPAERARIEAAGGFVHVHSEADMCALLRKVRQ